MKALFAYIDPGTGSLMTQSVIGTLLGVSYAIRKPIARFVLLFRKKGDLSK